MRWIQCRLSSPLDPSFPWADRTMTPGIFKVIDESFRTHILVVVIVYNRCDVDRDEETLIQAVLPPDNIESRVGYSQGCGIQVDQSGQDAGDG